MWAATENFKSLVRFVASLGVQDLQRHFDTADLCATYLSSKSVTNLLNCMSRVINENLLESLRGKKSSLLADESTDQSNRTQFSVFCRWEHR